MKKIILTLIMTLTIMIIPIVKASNILTMNASESTTGEISISGTTDSSIMAVAILIYDSTGENLVTMQTTQVNDDNTFNTTLTLDADTYVVKVADYEGGEYLTSNVSPDGNISVPNTLDNIVIYIGLSIVAVIGIVASVIYLKRKKA